MTSWDHYRYFLAVQRCGSLKGAAEKLSVDQTTVGRNISALEKKLGARLFERRSNGFILSAAGERIVRTLRDVESTLIGVERVLVGEDERPEGRVRIAMPGAFADYWLLKTIQSCLVEYPGIQFELITGAEVLNLARREADIAIRLVRPDQHGLVMKQVGRLELRIYGSKSLFLEKNKIPRKKTDLLRYPWIGLYADCTSDAELEMIQRLPPNLKCVLRTGGWGSVFSAVQSGLGIGILPTFIAEREAQLIHLAVTAPVTTPIWLVTHPDVRKNKRVRVILDYLTREIAANFPDRKN